MKTGNFTECVIFFLLSAVGCQTAIQPAKKSLWHRHLASMTFGHGKSPAVRNENLFAVILGLERNLPKQCRGKIQK